MDSMYPALSLDKIIKMLQDVFHVSISHKRLQVLQSKYVQKYSSTYKEIEKGLMGSTFIHADETTGSVKDLSTGYVWVFANIDSALYMFKRNREADFLLDLLKNKEKLFTFIEYDGIPWNNNNNNAENAVKSFAYSRTLTKNQRKEKGMSDYLVWLSILQTCKYRGINFLEF